MRTTLVICLLLATHSHAGSVNDVSSSGATSFSTSTTSALENSLSAEANISSSSPFDVDKELAKIASTCLSVRNYEELTGNIVRGTTALVLCVTLIEESIAALGLAQLRSTLNFGPPRPWQLFNETKPSEDELASAPNIEAYYDLKEPRSRRRSLDNYYLFEHNIPPAIAYFDRRFPAIREIFRRKFEEVRGSNPGVLDRKVIDRLIEEFLKINDTILDAIYRMRKNDDKCWRRLD